MIIKRLFLYGLRMSPECETLIFIGNGDEKVNKKADYMRMAATSAILYCFSGTVFSKFWGSKCRSIHLEHTALPRFASTRTVD